MSPVTSFNSGRKFSNPKNWSFYRALIWIFEKRAAIGSDDFGIEPTTVRNMHVSLRNGRRFIRPLLNLVNFPDLVSMSLIAQLVGAQILAKKIERNILGTHKWYRMSSRCTPAKRSFINVDWELKYRMDDHVLSNERDSKVILSSNHCY